MTPAARSRTPVMHDAARTTSIPTLKRKIAVAAAIERTSAGTSSLLSAQTPPGESSPAAAPSAVEPSNKPDVESPDKPMDTALSFFVLKHIGVNHSSKHM